MHPAATHASRCSRGSASSPRPSAAAGGLRRAHAARGGAPAQSRCPASGKTTLQPACRRRHHATGERAGGGKVSTRHEVKVRAAAVAAAAAAAWRARLNLGARNGKIFCTPWACGSRFSGQLVGRLGGVGRLVMALADDLRCRLWAPDRLCDSSIAAMRPRVHPWMRAGPAFKAASMLSSGRG